MTTTHAIDRAICCSFVSGTHDSCSIGPETLLKEGSIFTISVLGKIFFIPISGKLAGSNLAYKVALDYGNVTSFSVLTIWCIRNIVTDILKSKKPEYKELTDEIQKTGKQASIAVIASIGGLVARVPFGYLAAKYNKNGKIAKGVITVVSESPIPIYSLMLSLGSLSCRKKVEFVSKVQKCNAFLCEKIRANQDSLALLTNDHRHELATFFNFDTSEEFSHEIAERFLLRAIEPFREADEEAPASKCRSTTKTIVDGTMRVVGEGLWLAQVYLDALITYDAMKEWTGSEGGAISSACITGACVAYLTHQNITLTAKRVSSFVQSQLCCNKAQKSLAFDLRPKLVSALSVLSFVTLALAHGPSVQISKDYFSGGWSRAFQALFPVSIIFFIGPSFIDLVNEVVIKWEARSNHEDTKLVAQLYLQLSELIDKLKSASHRKLAQFILESSDELFDNLTEKLECSRDELRALLPEADERTQLLEVTSQ